MGALAAASTSITDTGSHPFAILVIILVVLLYVDNKKGSG